MHSPLFGKHVSDLCAPVSTIARIFKLLCSRSSHHNLGCLKKNMHTWTHMHRRCGPFGLSADNFYCGTVTVPYSSCITKSQMVTASTTWTMNLRITISRQVTRTPKTDKLPAFLPQNRLPFLHIRHISVSWRPKTSLAELTTELLAFSSQQCSHSSKSWEERFPWSWFICR